MEKISIALMLCASLAISQQQTLEDVLKEVFTQDSSALNNNNNNNNINQNHSLPFQRLFLCKVVIMAINNHPTLTEV